MLVVFWSGVRGGDGATCRRVDILWIDTGTIRKGRRTKMQFKAQEGEVCNLKMTEG